MRARENQASYIYVQEQRNLVVNLKSDECESCVEKPLTWSTIVADTHYMMILMMKLVVFCLFRFVSFYYLTSLGRSRGPRDLRPPRGHLDVLPKQSCLEN
jgi:hypothetical protein